MEVIKMIKDICKEHGSCGECPFYNWDCLLDDSPIFWDIEKLKDSILEETMNNRKGGMEI